MDLSSGTSDASIPSSAEPSSTARRWKYDVYLSFRSSDTRRGVVSMLYPELQKSDTRRLVVPMLYHELQKRGIETFMPDHSLEAGHDVSSQVVRVIEESRFAIVVFSPNYASSTWCLEELTKICECMNGRNTILPLYYKVDPSEVGSQSGRFGELVFSMHESSGWHSSEKLGQWRAALREVANASGWISNDYRSDIELVNKIVDFMWSKVQPEVSKNTVKQENDFTMSTGDVEENEARKEAEVMKALKTVGDVSVPSSTDRRWKYDVYLSFRGYDTRNGITSDLYNRLRMRGIEIFWDPHLEAGAPIAPTLLEGMEDSRLAIVVLSRNYASSSWCLEELTKICQCMEDGKRIVPLFYNVEPSDVKYCKNSFGEAFDRHESSGRHNSDKLQQWRDALKKVASFSGWDSMNFKTESELVEAIVESVFSMVEKIKTGDSEAVEATKQATIETELSMSKSIEDVFSDTLSEYSEETTEATDEIEPKPTEGFEAVEKTRQATNGNSPPQWKHDVFLSFRGEDTRGNFLSHLYHELQNTKIIRTFKDDEQLEKGKNISESLLTAIEESRFAIIVLSENYAFSAWCLDELTKIFQCMEYKHTILPIFYHVDPSDVRYQKNKFEEAFKKHSGNGRYNIAKVKQWSADLKKLGYLSGWDSKSFRSERELIVDIVKFVLMKVPQAPREDFEESIATKEAMDGVKEMLKNDKITAIGVYGRGGVGKTVMVKHVCAEAKRIGLYDHVVMAVISRNPDLRKIQGALVNQLGLELVEEEEIARAGRLKERIMGGKRLLIILDDIWEKIDLSSIGIPSHEELQRCNSKVILTTRMMKLCPSMGCQSPIPLNCLSEEDSLKFFMKKARKPFHGSIDEERNAVRECAGLPIVLEEAARAFGHKYEKEWSKAVSKAFTDNDIELQKAAQELNASRLVPTKNERDTFERIELSCHTLRFDDAKSFLLLCCMFPEDYDISIEELLKYAIGKGLLQNSDTLQEARDRAHSLVAYLKASGLLLDGQKGCLRMHSDVRKVAMSIAFSEGHAIFVKAGCDIKDWPMDAHEGYSAISLMRNELIKLPEILVYPQLQILLLQSNAGISHIPLTFFQSPNALRVFDLSYTGISVLPSSFNLLTNLQGLYLDCCNKITDVSVLGELKKLEILSLRKFARKELPKEIGKLTSLRMLDVTGGCFHKIPSRVISRLSRLEELYMKCEFGDWGSKVEEAVEQTNASFDEIIGLSHLNILKVYISDAACLPKHIGYSEPVWVEFDICISRDLFSDMMLSPNDQPLRFLTLDRTINGLSEWFINVVTQKAEKLHYRECKGLNNILEEYEHGRLHGLKHLSIIGCQENLEEWINATTWDPSKPVFESLEELHLIHLQCLKELCVGELPLGSLCHLKVLKVQTCTNLVNALLPPKLLQRLTHLEMIFCINMEHMKYVFGSEGLEPVIILLTKLSEMRLCALSALISIWNGPAPHAVFCNLKVLAVCKCTELKDLLPFNVAQSLVQLEDLSVESCPNLRRVIKPSNCLNRYVVFLGLKKLAFINLPELKWFCIENGIIGIHCPLLEYLYVDKCPQFIHSSSASASVKLNDDEHLNFLVKGWKHMYDI